MIPSYNHEKNFKDDLLDYITAKNTLPRYLTQARASFILSLPNSLVSRALQYLERRDLQTHNYAEVIT